MTHMHRVIDASSSSYAFPSQEQQQRAAHNSLSSPEFINVETGNLHFQHPGPNIAMRHRGTPSQDRQSAVPNSYDLERLNIQTVHEFSTPRNEDDPIRHGPDLRKPATFLDLPAELRIKIYPIALRYVKDQRIKLKTKTDSSSKIYVKEPTPPLCYAVPSLWDEVLSVYYRENRFHIRLFTQAQRNAFKTWVRHRGSLLKGLTYLRLNAWVSLCAIDVWGDLAEVEKDLYAVLHLMTNENGELVNWWRFKSHKSEICYTSCGCWLVQAVEEESRFEPTSSMQINPVVDFALKVCRIFDSGRPLCNQLVKLDTREALTAPLCSHCGGRRQTVVKDPAVHMHIIRKSSTVFPCKRVLHEGKHLYTAR